MLTHPNFRYRKIHTFVPMWKWYALLSAVFAALTAVLAKVGIRGVSGSSDGGPNSAVTALYKIKTQA